MRILVINGSPKGEKSDTMKLTRAFLDGMGEVAEIIDAATADIGYCLGCYGCWYATPGECVIIDGMAAVLDKLCEAELVIWSMPLYAYSMPASVKAICDRLLPLSCPAQTADENGVTHHPLRRSVHARMLLISGCGYPDRKNNYEALEFQFRRMFGQDAPMILCVEAPLLSIDRAAPVAEPYLALVRRAGAEYKAAGAISAATLAALDRPMLPPDVYRAGTAE